MKILSILTRLLNIQGVISLVNKLSEKLNNANLSRLNIVLNCKTDWWTAVCIDLMVSGMGTSPELALVACGRSIKSIQLAKTKYNASEIKIMDKTTFKAAKEHVFETYNYLLKKLAD